MRKLSLLAALTLVFSPALDAQSTIGAPGGSEVRTWGVGNTPYYGQTITTPSANLLDQFSVWLGRTSPLSSTPTPSIDFNAYVYAWNSATNTVSGAALYTSALTNHSATDATPFTRYDFATGGLNLAPGGMYALILGVAGGSGGIYMESTTGDEYTGGDFIFTNGAISSTYAVGFPTATDLRFEAQFSVPEPGTLLLFATGILGMAFVSHRRKGFDVA